MAARRYIVAGIFLLLASAGAYFLWEAYLKHAPAAGGGRPNLPVAVDAAAVKVGRVVRSVEAVGTLSANEQVVVRPEIDGLITEIAFREGQPVTQGQVLFRLDDRLLAAEVATAEANLALYEQNHRRARELLARGAGTERARDEAVADLARGNAALQLAQARLSKTVMHAPFDGVAGLRQVSVGDYVQSGEELVRLEQIHPMKVDFRVPELFLAEMRPGQQLRVTIDALPGQTFEGKVIALDPQVDVNGRALVLRALIDNQSGRLRPGLFARVEIILEQNDDALLLPESALVPSGRNLFVYRVEDGKAVRTPVEPGLYRNGKVEILNGLEAGDIVVTAGQVKLRDGSEVTLPESVTSPKAAPTDQTEDQTGAQK